MSTIADHVRLAREYFGQQPRAAQIEDPVVRVERIGPLRFRATDGEGHEAESDLPPEIGGTHQAMAPGSLLRSALGTCGATSITLEAASRGIELTRLEVEVSSNSDHRGLLGFDGVEPGPLSMRIRYRLASATASEEELRSLVSTAERISPVSSALRRQLAVEVEIQAG